MSIRNSRLSLVVPLNDLDFFFLSTNGSISGRSRSPVTFKCLYNAVSLSRYTFCLNCKLDATSVTSGTANDASLPCS